MTLDEMRGMVRSGIRDPAGTLYSDEAIDLLLNRGVKDIVLKTACYTGRWTRSTVVGTEQYALPSDCVKLLAMSYDIYRLSYTSDVHANINANNGTGTPGFYYVQARSYGLIPIPGEAKTLTLDGIKWPDDMSGEGTECPLPTEMHELPIMFAMYRASFMFDPQNVDAYLQRYLGELKRVQGDMRPPSLDEFPKINYVPSMVRGGYFKGTTIRIEEPD